MLRFAFLCVAALASKPPHLVMMVLDDVGWADVGYHGSDFPTPNIDRLAMQGLRLEKYYVQQVCSPTRSALMTGRYPFHGNAALHDIDAGLQCKIARGCSHDC